MRLKLASESIKIIELMRISRTFIAKLTFVQICVNLLDLLGILSISVLASNIGNQSKSHLTPQNIGFINLQTISIAEISYLVLGIFALKTILSVYSTRRIYKSLLKHAASQVSRIFAKYEESDTLVLESISKQNILYALSDGLANVYTQFTSNIVALIAELFGTLLITLYLFYINPFAFLLEIIVFGIALIYMQSKITALQKETTNRYVISNIETRQNIQEALDLHNEMKLARNVNFFQTRYSKSINRMLQTYSYNDWLQQLPKYIFDFLLVLLISILVVFSFTFHLISFKAGDILIFTVAASRMLPSLLRIQGLLGSINRAQGYFEITQEVLKFTKTEARDFEESVHRITNESSILGQKFISIQHISFSYGDPKNPILQDFSAKIHQNKITAIVGPSGVGKSTLIKLLAGLYKPTSGEILLNGEPLSDVLKAKSDLVSLVPQDVKLISGNLFENVTFDLNPNETKLARCLNALLAANFFDASMSNYDMLSEDFGESGRDMSGGQKQRLGIARAIYTDAKIILLDEPTSSLDDKSEHAITETLKILSQNKTIVLITHRKSTLKIADYVIDLVGEGSNQT